MDKPVLCNSFDNPVGKRNKLNPVLHIVYQKFGKYCIYNNQENMQNDIWVLSTVKVLSARHTTEHGL